MVIGRSVFAPERVAGDAERRGLLLEAAGVGDDQAGAALEREEVEVAQRARGR